MLALLVGVGCGEPRVEAPPSPGHQATPQVSAVLEGDADPVRIDPPDPWRTEVYRYVWPSLDATLLGVDADGRRAYIKLRTRQPARYVIDTVDIDGGERLDRWEAAPTQAPRLADYDARYAPLDGAPDHDLERLATMVSGWTSRASREGSAWPVVDASPDGASVVYMRGPSHGQQGDWLFLHDVRTSRAVRLGRQTVASYDAKFSPDGEQLAWRGCIGRRPCRYFLYLTSEERARAGLVPHRVAEARAPRGPVWSPDGTAVYVLATRRDERCVMRVAPPDKPWKRPRTTDVVCHDKLASFVLSPDGSSIAYTLRDGQEAEIAWRGVERDATPHVVQVRQTSEVTVSAVGLALVDHREGLLAVDFERQRRRMHVPNDGGFVFVPNVHWLDDDTAIMLEKSFSDGSVRLVRLDVAQFLDGPQ